MKCCPIEGGRKRKHIEARVMRSSKRWDEVVSRVCYRPRNRCVSDGRSREKEGCSQSSQVSFLTDGHCKFLPLLKSFRRNLEPRRRKMVRRKRRHPLRLAWIPIWISLTCSSI